MRSAPFCISGGAHVAISNKPWSNFSESDYAPEQWRSACLIHLSNDLVKSNHKLPVREPDGTINANGVHAAAAALAGARGGVQASPTQKRTAARVLMGMYGQMNAAPPDMLKRMAG